MENRKNGVLVLGVLWSVLFCAGLGPGQANAQLQYPEQILRFAEVVLYNGKILTMDRDDTNFSIQEAVAVRDRKILAVGDSQSMLAMAGPKTKKMDLQGRTVIPGAISSDSDNIFPGGDWTKTTQIGSHLVASGKVLEWGSGSDEDATKGNSLAGLTAQQLADLLNRSAEGLRKRYLAPMVRAGKLQLRYPQAPNRPDQAYTTADKKE